jgi:3-hydroxymyristoyl/3-hydroxydecanoyl-(acyl carrier protein) dehydratase
MLVDFTVGEQEPCVQGHFPGAPLVPGAWLLAKIDLCLRTQLPQYRVAGFTKVKFVAPLLPGMAAQLQGDLSQIAENTGPASVKLQIHSGGQLVIEAKARLVLV